MSQDIDLNLADKLQFCLNHENRLVESDDPDIYLRDRGGTFEPNILYFTLHWHGREIPARVHQHARASVRNDHGQWVSEVHWTVDHIGYEDHAAQGPAKLYEFQSKQEHICAANLFIKALRAYGGTFYRPDWNSFPEYREITATLSDGLKARIYGGLN